MKFITPIVFLLLIVTCTTYDSAVIYHKNFKPGNNPLLRFDGYYTDTLGPKPNPNSAMLAEETIKPVFFYAEGSAFSCDNYEAFNAVSNPLLLKGSWGNYLISGDTIQLEKFQLIGSNYMRIILKGVISKDQIRWVSRKDHTESAKPVDYTVFFSAYKLKPDSIRNFIRTKEKYNQ